MQSLTIEFQITQVMPMLNNDKATTGILFETNTYCDDEHLEFVIDSVLE